MGASSTLSSPGPPGLPAGSSDGVKLHLAAVGRKPQRQPGTQRQRAGVGAPRPPEAEGQCSGGGQATSSPPPPAPSHSQAALSHAGAAGRMRLFKFSLQLKIVTAVREPLPGLVRLGARRGRSPRKRWVQRRWAVGRRAQRSWSRWGLGRPRPAWPSFPGEEPPGGAGRGGAGLGTPGGSWPWGSGL